jgi:hypothetical protein
MNESLYKEFCVVARIQEELQEGSKPMDSAIAEGRQRFLQSLIVDIQINETYWDFIEILVSQVVDNRVDEIKRGHYCAMS